MTLVEKKQQLLAHLARCQGAQQKLMWLVAQARQRPPLEPHLRTDAFRVEGCLSKAWLVAEFGDGQCFFRCDSDSQVVRAIVGLLCDLYSGHPSAEILAHDPAFLREAGITQHLSGNRRNALSRVWETIRTFAEQHLDTEPGGLASRSHE